MNEPKSKDAWLGIIGVIGVCLTAGLALPLVNLLKPLEPEQLMVARGVLTATLAFMMARGRVYKANMSTGLMAFCFALACWGLYRGIRTWGASPTIVVITATPIVNFLFA